MTLTRTFHPVGQGAFYTETFRLSDNKAGEETEYNFVFDCGGADEKIMKDCINDVFPKVGGKRKDIDAVFISHFHEDHINGLEYLLKNCEVQQIILPLLSEEQALLLTIDFVERESDREFCLQLIKAASNEKINYFNYEQLSFSEAKEKKENEVKIIHVKPVYNNTEVSTEEISVFIDDENPIPFVLNAGESIGLKQFDWIFQPFNYGNKNNRRTEKLKDALNDKQITLNLDTLIQNWSNSKQDVHDAYAKVPGSMNGNSMVVYSGSKNNVSTVTVNLPRRCCIFRNSSCIWFPKYINSKLGCMYWGDYEAKGKNKWKSVMSFYKNNWLHVGIIQVPHHGSVKNYNDELNAEPKINIVSAGNENKYKHPSALVLKTIVQRGGIPIWVSEDNDSKFIIEYFF